MEDDFRFFVLLLFGLLVFYFIRPLAVAMFAAPVPSPTATATAPAPASLPFTSVPPAPPAPAQATRLPEQSLVCTGIGNGNLYVRQQPGIESPILGAMEEAERVTLTGRDAQVDGSQWVEIRTPLFGWVNAHFLCEASQ
jgi:hypothetical protein